MCADDNNTNIQGTISYRIWLLGLALCLLTQDKQIVHWYAEFAATAADLDPTRIILQLI